MDFNGKAFHEQIHAFSAEISRKRRTHRRQYDLRNAEINRPCRYFTHIQLDRPQGRAEIYAVCQLFSERKGATGVVRRKNIHKGVSIDPTDPFNRLGSLRSSPYIACRVNSNTYKLRER